MNARDEGYQTPLYTLLQHYGQVWHPDHHRNDQILVVTRLLLDRGADVNARDSGANANARDNDYETPLLRAMRHETYDFAQILLEHGADPNSQNKDGKTPLHMLSGPKYRYHPADDILVMAQTLLKCGADVNSRNKGHETPLLLAMRHNTPDLVQILLEHGADPNSEYKEGKTPLHVLLGPQIKYPFRTYYHQADYILVIAQLLLERDADVNARDNNHKTPLHLALQRQAFNIARFLLEQGANPNMENGEGDTPLHTLLLERNNGDDHDVPIFDLLLKHGADTSARNKNQANPLDLAPYYGKVLIAQMLLDHADRLEGENYSRKRSFSVTHFSIDRGVGVDVHQDKDYAARLRLACYCGRLDIVQALLGHGARTDAENFRGENALHLLSRGKHNSQEDGTGIARALLVRGADVNAQGNSHRTPLHLASCFGGPAIAKVLLELGAQADAVDGCGETPLHLLSRSKYHSQDDGVAIARLLLKYGADVNARDMTHRVPLHHASYNGMFAIAQVLLEHGGNLNAKDRHGETPLHLVLQSKYIYEEHGIARLLLEHGADIDVQDNNNVTPLDLSSSIQMRNVAKILIEYSASFFVSAPSEY